MSLKLTLHSWRSAGSIKSGRLIVCLHGSFGRQAPGFKHVAHPRLAGARLATIFFLCSFLPFHLHAQSANKLINKGNKLYEKQDYTDAEAEYKKALDKDKKSPVSFFNLGNSMYQQKRFEDAYQQYENSAKLSKGKSGQSAANYNMGNTFMENKEWEKSIPAFENALKLNPQDNEARYNLAYAQAMLKKQQGGGKNNKQQNKNKDQHKNNQQKNQQQNKQQDQNKDQQNKNNPQNNPDQQQEQQHPQPMPSKLTKQEADNLLNAVAQQEKQLQGKLDKKKKGVPVVGGKDW